MFRFKKLIVTIMSIFILYTIVGFFVVPPILKSILTKKLTEQLRREVSIQDIDMNPYALSLRVEGLSIMEPEGPDVFVSFNELYVNLEIISALKRGIIVREFRIETPYVHVIHREKGRFNFSDLIMEKKEEEETEETTGTPLRFSVSNIQLKNGSINVWDDPPEKEHKIDDINIMIPFISNLPYHVETFIKPSFHAKFNKTTVSAEGKTKPFADTLETVLEFELKDINIPYYLTYVPFKMSYKIPKGLLDVNGTLSYLHHAETRSAISLAGNIALKSVEIVDTKDHPILMLPYFAVSIHSAEPMAKKIHLSEILIQSPQVNVQRDHEGKINVLSLFPEKKAEKESPESKSNGQPFSIVADDMKLVACKILFSDLSGSRPFQTILNPINVNVRDFSNGKGDLSSFHSSLETDAGESLKLEGTFSIDPLTAEGSLHLEGVPIQKYDPYYGKYIAFSVEDGALEFQTSFKYDGRKSEPDINLSDMSIDLASLVLRKAEEKEPFVTIPAFSVGGTDLGLADREFSVGEIRTKGGLIHCQRYKNGDLNLTTLVPSSEEKSNRTEEATPKEKQWKFSLEKVRVGDYSVKMEDATCIEPMKLVLDNIRFDANDISSKKNTRGAIGFHCRLNKKGTFSAKGSVGITPLFSNVNILMNDLSVDLAQPYISEKIHIIITDGRLSTKGNLSMGSSNKEGITSVYKGEMALNDFICVDKMYADDLIKWKSLHFGDMDIGFNPSYIHIGRISLTDLFAHLIVSPDGKMNVKSIFTEKKDKESPEVKEKGQTFESIQIREVTLQGGHIGFLDKSIKPSFSTALQDIQGYITGLTSEETKKADVFFKGKIDNQSPLEITGTINPLKEELFADVNAAFKDIELSPLTPYSGKYVGYTIAKGKLSIDLDYFIDKKELDSKNHFFIDQLTFGDKTESPEATNLPVQFGVSLLKNRNGEIDLNLPVSGTIDDPEFKVGKIILKMVINLLVKAATSPFALLGAVFGGGEELSALEFDYGRSNISQKGRKRLDTLIKVLYERPALQLDIEGHVDIEQDREGLRQYMFNKKLQAQKLKQMVKKGLQSVPVDEVQIESHEYEEYLRKAYKAETFDKPENMLGMEKTLPVPEMEKLIWEHTKVEDDDLRLLAIERAKTVKEYLLATGKIEPQRIFLNEPESLMPEKKEELRESRVDLSLK
ncbi:MAG: DUF748 domain-containing protein [Thermodesulfobacteriota bacterium]|nr:DUF748 domain-containing protein [Thermodesulfobacteriota bacterium]